MRKPLSPSPLVTAKGFFTKGEKPFTFGDSLQRKGKDESSSRLCREEMNPPLFSPWVIAFGFFTEGEKPAPSASSPQVKSLSPLVIAYSEKEETSPSSKDRRFVSLRKTLPLTGSNKDEPLKELHDKADDSLK